MTDKKPVRVLSAEDILGSNENDFEFLDLDDVPTWKGGVTLRSLTAEQALDMNERIAAEMKENQGRMRGSNLVLVQLSVLPYGSREREGGLLFSKEDMKRIEKKAVKAVNYVAKRALKLNGIGEFADATEFEVIKND